MDIDSECHFDGLRLAGEGIDELRLVLLQTPSESVGIEVFCVIGCSQLQQSESTYGRNVWRRKQAGLIGIGWRPMKQFFVQTTISEKQTLAQKYRKAQR